MKEAYFAAEKPTRQNSTTELSAPNCNQVEDRGRFSPTTIKKGQELDSDDSAS